MFRFPCSAPLLRWPHELRTGIIFGILITALALSAPGCSRPVAAPRAAAGADGSPTLAPEEANAAADDEEAAEEASRMARTLAEREARLRTRAAALGMSLGGYRAAAGRIGPAPDTGAAAQESAAWDSAAGLIGEFLGERAGGDPLAIQEVRCSTPILARSGGEQGPECWQVAVRYQQKDGSNPARPRSGRAYVRQHEVIAFEDD